MKRASRPLLNRLLSGRDDLAAPDKEDVLEAVLARHAPRPRFASAWFRFGVPLATVAAAVVMVLAGPWLRARDTDFQARGAAAASFTMRCVEGGVAAPCRVGQPVLFKLEGAGGRAFTAFVTSPSGQTLWLFHNVDGQALPPSGVLERAPVLDEGWAGRLEVIGVFAEERFDKERVKALADNPPPGVEVVRRTLEVAP